MIKNLVFKNVSKIDSTFLWTLRNKKELDLINKGFILSADCQTNGIGNNGNIWDSQKDGIYLSLAFELHNSAFQQLNRNSLGLLTLNSGFVIANYINTCYQTNCVKIKWPNDIFLQGCDKKNPGGKLGGIKTQIEFDGETFFCVMGIGINWTNKIVANDDYQVSSIRDLPGFDKSLHTYQQKQLFVESLGHRLFDSFNELLFMGNGHHCQNSKKEIEKLIDQYNKNLLWKNREVVLKQSSENEIHGQLVGIGQTGQIIIKQNSNNKYFEGFYGTLRLT